MPVKNGLSDDVFQLPDLKARRGLGSSDPFSTARDASGRFDGEKRAQKVAVEM